MEIRLARLDDLPAITEIYNNAIMKTAATFDTEPRSMKQQEIWFNSHTSRFPIRVAEKDKTVIGWAAVSVFCDRCAYNATGEVSLYISENYRNKGYGRKLLEELIKVTEQLDYHVLIARIAEGNQASIHLFESLGFFHVGVMKEVGYKFNRLLDVYLMQKLLAKKF
ncbi:GNAT family N-acetyltransferase [candidate division WOR-3 bacterium RBG_13_43_14]|uniref:GNAT family N-acetyltransferase n=1 Tax=candidate division WOR-3 bacterium RBG_13_43_14 TaxID=1802590 RepID=A0A1F4UC45_UNCW3|nr:MAG: GNAT family N-acetyltransferase [candidate division WOR-3 bacterium RBG_13_43_14]